MVVILRWNGLDAVGILWMTESCFGFRYGVDFSNIY